MALGTGQLSLGDIAGEYGGSAPHALSEYYDKGNAPGSGEIQIHADFNGTANVFVFAISSNASQVNLRTLAVNAGWDESSPVSATINSGVIIDENKTLSGLAFNTGQLYNKQQDMKPSDPSMVYADGTKSQSNYLNPKNIT